MPTTDEAPLASRDKKPAPLSVYQITGVAPLSAFPISLIDFRELSSGLTLAEREMLARLFLFVFQHGKPHSTNPDELAKTAGVGKGRWIIVAPALANFFDVTEDGWGHIGLQEAHEAFFRQKLDRVGRRRPHRSCGRPASPAIGRLQ